MLLEQASIIREKRRTIKITINREGNLIVFCPFGISTIQIEKILSSKKNVLEKKVIKAKAIASKYSKIINQENILLFGKEYIIIPTTKFSKPSFTEEYFLVPKKYYNVEKMTYCIKKTVKDIAERVVVKRAQDIARIYNYKDVNKIIIGDFRAKWGSCDQFGVIKLNYKLAMLDPKLIDFVIFHELTHLKEMNHSSRFYSELEKICPDWKSSREVLKVYSFLLELY